MPLSIYLEEKGRKSIASLIGAMTSIFCWVHTNKGKLSIKFYLKGHLSLVVFLLKKSRVHLNQSVSQSCFCRPYKLFI